MKETPHLRRDEFGIEIRDHKPRGWHGLTGEPVRETQKAVQVPYYGWLLWLPKARCFRVDDQLFTPRESIENAKDHDSAERS